MTKERREKYIDKIKLLIIRFSSEYGIEAAGIFGSFVKGTSTKKSDIDLLVRFYKPIGFIKFVQLENKLTNSLKKKVDLVTENSLSPYFKNEVLSHLKIIYEKTRR